MAVSDTLNDQHSCQHILWAQEGHMEDRSGWSNFLSRLKERGLRVA